MRFWQRLMIMLLMLAPAEARADVVVSFYSHELDVGFRTDFPHAFVVVQGITADGRKVDTNFGFTAKSVSPAVLMGSVYGTMETLPVSYYAKSQKQFAITITDAQYDALLALVAKWRALPGKSYNLDKNNCIHFVGEAAQVLGLKVQIEKKLVRKPKSFLLSLIALNPWVKPTGK
jgi:hypothetical protein